MSERDWMRLRPGDFMVSKRQRGILFKITAIDAGMVRFVSEAGAEHEAGRIRCKEFVQYLPTVEAFPQW